MKFHRLSALLITVLVLACATHRAAAEEKMNTLQTVLSSTTISGYVDTSINWNGNGYVAPAPSPFECWWQSLRAWLRSNHWRW